MLDMVRRTVLPLLLQRGSAADLSPPAERETNGGKDSAWGSLLVIEAASRVLAAASMDSEPSARGLEEEWGSLGGVVRRETGNARLDLSEYFCGCAAGALRGCGEPGEAEGEGEGRGEGRGERALGKNLDRAGLVGAVRCSALLGLCARLFLCSVENKDRNKTGTACFEARALQGVLVRKAVENVRVFDS
jgi:hypothetical protein